MTSLQHINNTTILMLMMRNKTFYPIMQQYNINYNCITVLLSAYLYNRFINDKFSITGLYKFVSYYNHYRLIGYINKLVSIDLITLAGKRHYKLTSAGIQVIKDISNNMDHSLYNISDKYNISL